MLILASECALPNPQEKIFVVIKLICVKKSIVLILQFAMIVIKTNCDKSQSYCFSGLG